MKTKVNWKMLALGFLIGAAAAFLWTTTPDECKTDGDLPLSCVER